MLWSIIWLFLGAGSSSSTTQFAHQRVDVPAHEYRFAAVNASNWPVSVDGVAAVAEGAPVQVELLSHRDLESFVRGRAHNFVLHVQPRTDVHFRQALPDKGEYDILLVNEQDRASLVDLTATLEYAREPDVARYLSPAKRVVVISVSVFVFLIILSWSAFRLIAGMKGSNQKDEHTKI